MIVEEKQPHQDFVNSMKRTYSTFKEENTATFQNVKKGIATKKKD